MLAHFVSQQCKSTRNAPSVEIETAFSPAIRNVQFATPLSQSLSAILMGYQMIIAFIVRLHRRHSPFAIIRRVVAIIVTTFNRMFTGRTVAHISQEILKRIEPLFANLYSTASVIGKLSRFGIVATSLDVLPRIMLRRSVLSVRDIRFRCSLFMPTTARFCVAVGKVWACDDRNSPTRTFTEPLRVFALDASPCVTQNSQTPERLSGQIQKKWMSGKRNKFNAIFIVSHLVKDHSFNLLARAASVLKSLVRPVSILPRSEVFG